MELLPVKIVIGMLLPYCLGATFSEKYLGIKPALEVPAFKQIFPPEIAASPSYFRKDHLFKQRRNPTGPAFNFAFQFIALIQQLASRVFFAEETRGRRL